MLQLKYGTEIYTIFLDEKKELCRVISDLSSMCELELMYFEALLNN